MNFYFIMAAILLGITYWDYRRDETDTIFLLDWWAWFDISRGSWPVLYWLCLTAQIIGAITLIVCGLRIS